jgi:hypothetical protein
MTDDKQPKQKSRSRGTDDKGKPAKPTEVPVPKRREVDDLLKKAAKVREDGEDAVLRARKTLKRSDDANRGRRDTAKPPPRQHQRRGR